MPIYEYRCKQCDKVFELIQKFSDAPLTVHDACGGEVERLISAPGLHFKGSGWYITDYARSGAKPGGDSKDSKDSKDSGDSKESKKESSSGSESKSETKSDSSSSKSDSSSSSSAPAKKDSAPAKKD